MSEAFAECDPVPDHAPLRQGDLFVFIEGTESLDTWQWAGIVVTADCDLTNNKHAGIVSYVPVLPLREYLANQVMPKLAEDLRAQRLRLVLEIVRQLESARGDLPGLSNRAIEAWVSRDGGTAEMIAHLDPVGEDQRRRLTTTIEEIATCAEARDLTDFDDQFATLTGLYAPTKRKTSAQVLAGEVYNRLRNLPGDAFFISSIGEGHQGGFVAYLRLVREIRAHQIATSYYGRGHRGVTAYRISQLRTPYVYRLTQLLADVFASIGLPEEYEAARATVFDEYLQLMIPVEVA